MSDRSTLDDLRVVHVDDDADQRLTIAELLASHGIRRVTSASDAESGLQIVTEQQPDLVLLDLSMPGRSGLDVLPELRAASPEATIVVLSSLSRRRLLDEVVRRGAIGFVEKSTAPSRLVDEILVAAMLTEAARVHTIELSSDVIAPSQARRFTTDLLAGVDRELVADLELIVSELVTNSVVHTTSAPQLRVYVSPRSIRVEAYDDDPTMPSQAQPSVDQPGGRGLLLVDRLSSRWGSEPHGAGKMVWAEMARRRPDGTS